MRVPHELLRETIIIQDFTGAGALGPVYSADRSVRANVQATNRLSTDAKGAQVTIDALVIIRPESGPVRPESRILWAGETYRVASSYAMPNTFRPSQWELQIVRFVR